MDKDFNGTHQAVIDTAISFLTKERPYFTFVHFGMPDHAGHDVGHDTPEYYREVKRVDAAVGEILEALEKSEMIEQTLILFSSDHGGIDKGHGGKTLLEMEIPWIIWGAGVKKNGELSESIITYDTAATLAYVMGLDIPQSWRGQAQKQVFKK